MRIRSGGSGDRLAHAGLIPRERDPCPGELFLQADNHAGCECGEDHEASFSCQLEADHLGPHQEDGSSPRYHVSWETAKDQLSRAPRKPALEDAGFPERAPRPWRPSEALSDSQEAARRAARAVEAIEKAENVAGDALAYSSAALDSLETAPRLAMRLTAQRATEIMSRLHADLNNAVALATKASEAAQEAEREALSDARPSG